MIDQPWTAVLTRSEHDLILFGLVVAGLTLLATLVRFRFTAQESYGSFRVASLTANAVVAIALVSYVGLVAVYAVGYDVRGTGDAVVYAPNALARYAWALRYMDWIVTVPLLVIELIAISALNGRAPLVMRRVGMVAAAVMIAFGFLGAFVVADGRDLTTYSLFGVGGAVCFAVLYGLFFVATSRTLPRLPDDARRSYRTAVVLLLIIWLVYPMVYGFSGVVYGGVAAVIGQLALCGADMIAKIGFGTLVHRTAVLRSRQQEQLDPTRPRRPRSPISDSVYVSDARSIEFDSD